MKRAILAAWRDHRERTLPDLGRRDAFTVVREAGLYDPHTALAEESTPRVPPVARISLSSAVHRTAGNGEARTCFATR